ncbi:male-specific lethal 1 homolog [Anabrus simplex]|uniref:male-specific lethal 1 homolog n=1 Tax=Anabrus simplex TaxID=316456 RepID=UPI0035A2E8A4
MSNASPVLNGENTSGVGDFATDASVNMVAAIHDHISCAKPVPVDPFNSPDTKAGIMTYSCEFDHMYASLTDGATVQKESAEIKHLKELLLLHLDLIQQQSEQIVTKDKQISALRQENETLRQRLERMDRRVTLQKHREAPEVFMPSLSDCVNPPTISPQFSSGPVVLNAIPPLIDTESDAITIPLDSFDSSSQNNVTVVSNNDTVLECQTATPTAWEISKRRRRDPESGSASSSRVGRRKRLSSWTSSVNSGDISHDGRNSIGKDLSEHRRVQKRVRTKAAPAKKDSFLTTETLYYTPVGDPDSMWCGDESELSGHLEVPSWRYKVYTSCYSMEGTENLDDEVFNKRHQRLEIDERRRKRWDVQRIREQRQIERLKSREQAAMRKDSRHHDDEPLASLWPQVDDAQYLEVGDTIPVAAFGLPITKFTASEFSLPWLTSARCKTPSSSHTSTRRRHEHKR